MSIKYSIHMIWLIVLILFQSLSGKCEENVTVAQVTSALNSSGQDVALETISDTTRDVPIYSLVTKHLPIYLRDT